jgi:hypothetical protein
VPHRGKPLCALHSIREVNGGVIPSGVWIQEIRGVPTRDSPPTSLACQGGGTTSPCIITGWRICGFQPGGKTGGFCDDHGPVGKYGCAVCDDMSNGPSLKAVPVK